MGWEDRPYYRDAPQRGSGNPLMWLWGGSVPLGTYLGIRVRMHAMMLIFMGIELLSANGARGIGLANAATAMTILFFSVLLHEFGHCFGARWTGGDASDILMWPLGGLASTSPPHRWTAHLIMTACGPAVNVAICILTALAIAFLNQSAEAIPWFPLTEGLRTYIPHDETTRYLWWVFLVNYALTMFNILLVFFPFDGGRIVQALLWWRLGYYRSMRIATTIGMIGGIVTLAVGAVLLWPMLMLIAGFGFYASYRSRQTLAATGPPDDPVAEYSVAHEAFQPRRTQRSIAASVALAEKRRKQERAEQAKIDQILAKVSAKGMNSLTWWEKRSLRLASERQRASDRVRARSARR